MECVDGKPKKGFKDEGSMRINVQSVLERGNIKSESVKSGCDFSVATGLFGPVWDNFYLKDGGREE